MTQTSKTHNKTSTQKKLFDRIQQLEEIEPIYSRLDLNKDLSSAKTSVIEGARRWTSLIAGAALGLASGFFISFLLTKREK